MNEAILEQGREWESDRVEVSLWPRPSSSLAAALILRPVRTSHQRSFEAARNLLFKLADGEGDPIELELAAGEGLIFSL